MNKKPISFIGIILIIILLWYARDLNQFFLGSITQEEIFEQSNIEQEEVKILKEINLQCRKFSDGIYDENIHTFSEAKTKYHDYINCIFNEAQNSIMKSVNFDESEIENICNSPQRIDDVINKIVIADIIEIENPQTKELIKTPIGIAMLTTEEYEKYRLYLDAIQKDPIASLSTFERAYTALGTKPVDNENALLTKKSFTNAIEVSLLSDVIDKKNEMIQEIKNEKEKSRQALDISLRALNELKVAYPLHKKYECIINEIKKYKDEFARLRRIVNCLPGKFKEPRTDK